MMVRKSHPKISIVKQCDVLQLNRSSLYKSSKGESAFNLELMEKMDEHYMQHPYKGSPSMYVYLTKDMGYKVSRNRIDRLYYNVMGLRAIVPGPHTSKRNKDHKIYPYLLRDLVIERPNQVWAADITYIPVEKGYIYLVAIIDLYSRYVLNWSLSNTMDAKWCKEALQEAMRLHGRPDIVNTDQGSQFTSDEFTGVFKEIPTKLSMDGKGRATDNAFIERLWRSVKYEKIYLHRPNDGLDCFIALQEYFNYYNFERRHSSINDYRPAEIYEKRVFLKQFHCHNNDTMENKPCLT